MISSALEHFKKGHLVIFPTDTLYGIGCSINSESSIKRLYKVRKTPLAKPTLILTSDLEQASDYGYLSNNARDLATTFWPGPLTLITKAKNKVPKSIQGKGNTIALRIPKQPPIISLIKKLGCPILAPSANFHGLPAPTMFNKIDKELLALVDYAIDISYLDNALDLVKIPSTLIDISHDNIEIIREGAISSQEVQKAQGGLRT